MPPPASAAGAVKEQWRWPVHIVFLVLVVASLGLLLIVGVQSWQELHTAPDVRVWVNDGSKDTREQVRADIRTTFEWYRDRVDNLQKLIAVLIGLSSLYAVVIAVTSYLNGQTYLNQLTVAGNEFLQEMKGKAEEASVAVNRATQDIEEARVQLDEAKRTSEELQCKFNTFVQVNENLGKLIDSVNQMLPDTDPLLPKYESLSGEIKEQIYYWERSLAFAEVLAGDQTVVVNERISQAFVTLGRFYRTRFRSEKSGAGVDFNPAIPRSDWTAQQRDIFSLLDRALMYGQMAVARDPHSASAWTEWAISRQNAGLHDLAVEALHQSLRLRADQQKARYFMSISWHRQERYSNAEAILTDALSGGLWEDRENLDRRPDLFYNRACARSRLASASSDTAAEAAFAQAALTDLDQGCPQPNAYRLEVFTGDCEPTGDLAYLVRHHPGKVRIIQERLSGKRPSI